LQVLMKTTQTCAMRYANSRSKNAVSSTVPSLVGYSKRIPTESLADLSSNRPTRTVELLGVSFQSHPQLHSHHRLYHLPPGQLREMAVQWIWRGRMLIFEFSHPITGKKVVKLVIPVPSGVGGMQY
jgi:hypothetical protein